MSKRWMLLAFMVISLVFMGMSNGAHAQVYVSNTDAGQVIIFPYYDVTKDANCVAYSIVNTSCMWIQGHLVFREAKKSIEVLDMDVILSPHDVFVFYVVPNVYGGQPGMYSPDPNTLAYSCEFFKNVSTWGEGAFVTDESGDLCDPEIAKHVGVAFKTVRLEAVGFDKDAAAEMIKKGYIEFVVEGAIEDAWMDFNGDHVNDFVSLNEAVRYDNMGVGKQVGQSDPCDAPGNTDVDHCAFPGFSVSSMDTCREISTPTNPVFGTIHYVDLSTFTGYGQNAFQLACWRVPDDGAHHIDDGYIPPDLTVPSGLTRGLLLHDDWLLGASDETEGNPFFRPDWATTRGPTIAFGNDYDDYAVGDTFQTLLYDVWGSVNEIENALVNAKAPALLGRFISYQALDVVGSTVTQAQFTFPTKYFHFYTQLLYDHVDPVGTGPTFGSWTVVNGMPSSVVDKDRTKTSDYNVNAASASALAMQDIDCSVLVYDTKENIPAGVSPIQPPPLDHEAGLYDVGPQAEFINTGNVEEGWFGVYAFELQVDADADGNCDNETWPVGFIMYSAGDTGQLTTNWIRGYQGCGEGFLGEQPGGGQEGGTICPCPFGK